MTRADIVAVAEGVTDAVKDIIDELAGRVRIIEERADASATTKFCGQWDGGVTYEIGDITQFAGTSWIAVSRSKNTRPSTDSYSAGAWQVFASRGRPGKSAPGHS